MVIEVGVPGHRLKRLGTSTERGDGCAEAS